MKFLIVIVVLVLLVPTSVFAQYMGNVGDPEPEDSFETQTQSIGLSEDSSKIDPMGADCMSKGFWINSESTCSFDVIITNDSTGGECTKIGNWNNSTKTCFISEDKTIRGSNGILIMDDGITVEGGGHVFRGSEGVGIAIVEASNVKINDFDFQGFQKNAFILNSEIVSLSESRLTDPTVGPGSLSRINLLIENSAQIEIKDNYLDKFSGSVRYSQHVSFLDNEVRGNLGTIHTTDVVFHGNTFNGRFSLGGTGDVEIVENIFARNDDRYSGIYIKSSETPLKPNMVIQNNTFDSEGGIVIEFSDFPITVIDNTFSHRGISIASTVGNHIVSGNVLKEGELRISGGSDSVISGNLFENKNSGISFIGSKDNVISKNNFYSFLSPVGLSNAIDLSNPPIPDAVSSGNIMIENYWSEYDSEDEGCFDENLDDYCDDSLLISSEFLEQRLFEKMGGTKVDDNWKKYHSESATFSKAKIYPNDLTQETVKSQVDDFKQELPSDTSSGTILSFVDPEKDPFHYINRYVNEPKYKEWFDSNYQDFTIYDAVGVSEEEYLEYIKPKPDPEPQLICGEGTEWIDGECRPIKTINESDNDDVIPVDPEPATSFFTNSGLMEDQWVKYQITMVDIDASGSGMYFSPEALEASLLESFLPTDESGNIIRNTDWLKLSIDTVTNSKYKISSFAGLTNGDEKFLNSETRKFELNNDFLPLVIPVNLEDGDAITIGDKEFEIQESTLTVNDKKLDVFILTNEERKTDQSIVTEFFSEAIFHKSTGMLLLSKVEMSARGQGNSFDAEFGMHAIDVSDHFLEKSSNFSGGGGCLIATATYGSELALQVQQLREIRDSTLLTTESGTNFMNSFNQFYYSFSPIIADYERENPAFREMVKIAITPMITSLSLMEYADSESSVLGIGISLIVLNGLMYVGVPVFVILRIKK